MAARFLKISSEISHALAKKQPLVFLESAIVTHGLPFPHNSSLPIALEAIVRQHGAVPCTVGILDGLVHVGLSKEDIERLANDERREKASIREIPHFIAQKKSAGLTVSGTLEVMRLVGHQGVFVTGGIGGVHRGAATTFDISSDLTTLARTPGMVVCSGPKSILDIPLTLEYLETFGVFVGTYKSPKFPAFYTSDSGCKSPQIFDSFQDAAQTLWTLNVTGRQSGMLLANPISKEFEERGLRIQKIVEDAVRKAEEEGINKLGKNVTPWILDRVAKDTRGESVQNNIALIEHNAHVGSQVAVEYSTLERNVELNCPSFLSATLSPVSVDSATSSLAVIGCAAVDITSQHTSSFQLHTTVPGKLSIQLGGVARNVAHAATLLSRSKGYSPPILIAPVASDEWASLISERMKNHGMVTRGLLRAKQGCTPTCTLVLDQSGGLVAGTADMSLVEHLSGKDIIYYLENNLHELKMVCLDGNISMEAMRIVLDWCHSRRIEVAFEPTSDEKSMKILDAISPDLLPPLTILTPNQHEVAKMASHPIFGKIPSLPIALRRLQRELPYSTLPDIIQPIFEHTLRMTYLSTTVFAKLGPKGVLVTQRVPTEKALPPSGDELLYHVDDESKTTVIALYVPPTNILGEKDIGTVVGAGDSMLAGLLTSWIYGKRGGNGRELMEWTKIGMKAAEATLRSFETVGKLDELKW